MDNHATHVQRCNAICDTLNIPQCHGPSFARVLFDLFPPQGTAAEIEATRRRLAYFLYAAFLGRLPHGLEISQFQRLAVYSDPESSALLLSQRVVRRGSEPAVSASLFHPPPHTLIVDVTHTLKCPHTSGIQRVVRSLSRSIESNDYQHLFVRYCKRSHRYIVLNAHEISQLISPQGKLTSHRLGARLWSTVTGVAQRRLGRLIGRQEDVGVLFWKNTLLLPEVITEYGRIDALTVILTSASISSTMLIYDLIPVRHAEYFPDGFLSAYMRYLTLLRHVDAISCISQSVRDDLTSLLPLLARTKPQPHLAVHYLGADFPASDIQASLPTMEHPLVLCVGTIEPRKNQLRILDAMAIAQSRGCEFTGLFVGNAGWLNGEFRDCLERYASRGHRLLLREHASDAELDRIYRASAFTIYCSLAEGFGLPIIESVVRGKVCITSNRGSMKEIAARIGGCILVNPEDSDAISTAIQRLLHEPALLEQCQKENPITTWPSWHDHAREVTRFIHGTFASQDSSSTGNGGDVFP